MDKIIMPEKINAQLPSEEKLDPAVERIRRRLTTLMFASILITLFLLFLIFGAILYKIKHSSSEQVVHTHTKILTATLKDGSLILPKGSKILSQSITTTVLSLEILTEDKKHYIILYDYKTDHILKKITI